MTRALNRESGARRLTEHRVEQQIQRRAPRRADVDAEHFSELSLRIEIHEQHALAALARQEVTDAGDKRRLAASALLVDEGDATRVRDYPPGSDAPWPSVRRSCSR